MARLLRLFPVSAESADRAAATIRSIGIATHRRWRTRIVIVGILALDFYCLSLIGPRP